MIRSPFERTGHARFVRSEVVEAFVDGGSRRLRQKIFPRHDRISQRMAHERGRSDVDWTNATDKAIEPRDLGLAEKIATRANNAAKGRDINILNTLARVLFMRRKKKAAIQLQSRAVALVESEEKEGLQKTLDNYRKGELPKPE